MKFKEFLNNKKTYVYHISPVSNLKKIRPTGVNKGQQSVKMGKAGIYVAPKFKDAVAWGTTYVAMKKYDTQKRNERVKELGIGTHGEKGPKHYQELTIYKIEIPKEILNKSEIWRSSFWEPEYFIPEEYVDEMRIVQSKTYTTNELSLMYNKFSQKRMEFMTKDIEIIKKISKTNLAAKYYLELITSYNNALLKGKKPIISDSDNVGSEHFIRQKIENLKQYMFSNERSSWRLEPIVKVDKNKEKIIENLYKQIKKNIENL